jgi:hypothetical protein
MEDNVKVLMESENGDICILWVSERVVDFSEIVDWVGGFIAPKNGVPGFTSMDVMPVEDAGDMIVFLTDYHGSVDIKDYFHVAHSLAEKLVYNER